MAAIVLSADTSLDSSVQLNWTIIPSSITCTTIGSVAGYITVTDTSDYTSTPVDIYLSQDEISVDKTYIVKNLSNGVKYAFCLSVYTTSFENILKSNIILDTPGAVPDALLLDTIVDLDETPSGVSPNNVDISLNVRVGIKSNGGLPIERINLYLVDVSNYSYVSYEYSENAFTLSPNTTVRLPIGNAKLNKLYYIYGEAINESGSSKPSNRIVLNTTNKPSNVDVTQVVSGLDRQLKVSLSSVGNVYPLVKATILLWDISDNSISNWSSTNIISKSFTATDASGGLILNNLIVDNLQNAHVYKVAAYVTNTFQDGDHVSFTNSQIKTGVPALLPTLADFNNNFSLTSIVNSLNSPDATSIADGSLTVNTLNDGLTNPGSDRFTFNPLYKISFADMSGSSIGYLRDSYTSFFNACSQSGLNVLAGTNYKAKISISCSVPANLQNYWLTNPQDVSSNWDVTAGKKTLADIFVDTTAKPSDLIIDNVVSGLDRTLKVTVKCAGSSISQINDVYVLAWRIDQAAQAAQAVPPNQMLSIVPTSWKTTSGILHYKLSPEQVNALRGSANSATLDISMSSIDSSGVLVNGIAYQIAAYAVNNSTSLSSLYEKFAINQMKTGVPALLPTLADFNNNFSLTSIVNSLNSPDATSIADGSLTVNTLNDGLTNPGSGRFTFNPLYNISFANMAGSSIGDTVSIPTPFSIACSQSGLNVLAGTNYKAKISISCYVPLNLRNFWLTNPQDVSSNWDDTVGKKTLADIFVDTTAKPSDLIIDNVVSGLDRTLKVTVKCAGSSISQINDVYVLAWRIDQSSIVPTSWKTTSGILHYKLSPEQVNALRGSANSATLDISMSSIDSSGVLVNGIAYQIAAYAVNNSTNLSSLYEKFAINQMKTGVPALLPTLADFNNNFSLTSIVNSLNSPDATSIADGSLTVNTLNDGLTNPGSGRFTFNPLYKISFADMSGSSIGYLRDSYTSFFNACSQSGLNVLAGTNYKAKISISCYVPLNLRNFWLTNPQDVSSNWDDTVGKKTLADIFVDTTAKPSDLIIDNVVSGLDRTLKVTVKCAGSSISQINDVYVLAWRIDQSSIVPTSWKTTSGILHYKLSPEQVNALRGSANSATLDISMSSIDSSGVLVNGIAYQIAAYAVNNSTNLSSLYEKFAINQMKTGVPALLPTLADFNNNFSLTSIVNSLNSPDATSIADGSLTVNTLNDGLTNPGSGRFTFNPLYNISFANMAGSSIGDTVSILTPFSIACSQSGLNVLAGTNYKAKISISCSVPANLQNYWLTNPQDLSSNWNVTAGTKTLADIFVDTTAKPSDLIIDNVVSGLNRTLKVTVKCAGSSISQINDVYVLAWRIGQSSIVPTSWKTTSGILHYKLSPEQVNALRGSANSATLDISMSSIDSSGVLVNGIAYQIAAYAVNNSTNLSSLYEKFAINQMKTGVPALLPTLADFNNNFSIDGTLTGFSNGGSLTVSSATNYSSMFTFYPVFVINITKNGTLIHSNNNVTNFPYTANVVTEADASYNATVDVVTNINNNSDAVGIKEYWSDRQNINRIYNTTPISTFNNLYMSVLPSKPNNLSAIVERDSELISKLGFTLRWTDPSFNGYSDILGYIVQVYTDFNCVNNIYTAYLSRQADPIKHFTVKTNNLISSGSAIYYISPANLNTTVDAFGMQITGNNYGMDTSRRVPASASPSDITKEGAFLAGSQYYFKVSAVNKNGFGDYSDALRLVMSEPPASVENVQCTQVLVVNHNDQAMPPSCDINMSWNLPTYLYGLKTNYTYNIYRRISPSNLIPLGTVTGDNRVFKARDIPNTSNFDFEIEMKVEDLNNVLLTGAPYRSTFRFYKVPEINLGFPSFVIDSNGNGKFMFSVNNGGSSLIGLLVMVLPDVNIPSNIDPVININTSDAVNNRYTVGPSYGLTATLRSDNETTDFVLSLNYKIPNPNPSFLVVATNSVGNDVYSRNLSVSN